MPAAQSPCDVGLVGLAIMGQNLALNIAEHGHSIAVYNRSTDTTRSFVARSADELAQGAAAVHGCESLAEFVASLSAPRKILLLVRAGSATDAVIDSLVPLLDEGDIVVDCGNSFYGDTERRLAALADRKLRFVGCGVSGGEVGARYGPSIMPGGDESAWPHLEAMLKSVAAVAGDDDAPCCDWLGPGSAGHYVKMVHNGIEYADMQLIAEAYHVMADVLGLDHARMAKVFDEWNAGPLKSYLIEITARIMAAKDEDGAPLLERILDAAGQKGTGKWTANAALDLGQPVTLIGEAVFARCLSALKDARVRAAEQYGKRPAAPALDTATVDSALAELHDAVLAAKTVCYAQGFMLLDAAAEEHGWKLPMASIARLWRAGCIIRSVFLNDIAAAFERDAALANLLFDPFFVETTRRTEAGLRRSVVRATEAAIPVPVLGAALAFLDGYRSARLPANLLQAQRDFFGGHTYERTDRPRGEWFHTDWAGTGAAVVSGSYSA